MQVSIAFLDRLLCNAEQKEDENERGEREVGYLALMQV